MAQNAKIGFSTVCQPGNGASATICSVVGTPQASVSFGAGSLPTNFTICSVTRYAGATSQFQILNSKVGSFVHGHHNGRAAAATYANSIWLTLNSDYTCPGSVNCIPQLNNLTMDWLIFCGQNGGNNRIYANGQYVGLGYDVASQGGNIEFGVNYALDSNIRSNFGIMEIAVWNRFLSDSEIQQVSRYYANVLRGAAPQYQLFVCTACAPGTFSTAQSYTACDLCAAGKYSTTEGADTLSACQSCRAGKYSSAAGAGLNETLVCSSCAPGSFSTAVGAVACAACSPGSYSAGYETLRCDQCLTGTYSPALGAVSSDTCIACPRGTFVPTNGSSACLACAAGRYSEALGARSSATCASCTGGTYSSATGASGPDSCAACAAGTYSTALAATSPGICAACQAGTYSSLVGANSRVLCTACPAGKYNEVPGASACGLCRPGSRELPAGPDLGARMGGGLSSRFMYSGWNGVGQWADRVEGSGSGGERYGGADGDIYPECSAGGGADWVCAVKGQRGAGVRFGAESVPAEFTVCSVTRYGGRPGAGGGGWGEVLNAVDGYWVHGHAAGQAGVANYSGWKTNQTTPPGVDPAGWLVFCGQNGPAGLFYANGQSVGLPNAAGGLGGVELALNGQDCCRSSEWAAMEVNVWSRHLTLQELEGVWDYYAAVLNGTFAQYNVYQCASCAAGTYSTGFGGQSCLLCAAGDYSTATGATVCAHCAVGTYSPAVGVSDGLLCHPCSAGTYVSVLGSSRCEACAAGTFGTLTGATGAAACTECAVGEYSSASGAASPATCSMCGAGTFSTAQGAVSSDICTKCAAGTYSTGMGTGACSLCAVGKYSTSLAATDASTCGTCGAGTYLSTPGASAASDCTPCDAGTYSLGKGRTSNSFCVVCGRGKYQASRGQSSESACTFCGPGTYSSGIGMVSADSCIGCSVGTYSTALGLQGGCGACSSGTFILTTSATACETCGACPIGQFQASPCIATQNIACLPLQYQAPMILKYFAAFGQLPLAAIVTVYVLYTALFFGKPLLPFPEFVAFWWELIKGYFKEVAKTPTRDWVRMPITIICWPFVSSVGDGDESNITDATWSILKGSYDFISDMLFLTVLEPANPYGHFWIVFSGLSASVLVSCLLSMLYNEPVLLYITSSSQYFHSGYSSSIAANINRVQILLFETGPVLFVQIWLLLILFGATTSEYSWIDWMILIQSQAFTVFNMTKNLFFLRRKLFGQNASLKNKIKRGSAYVVRKGSAFVLQVRKLSQASQQSAENVDRRVSLEDNANAGAYGQVVFSQNGMFKTRFQFFEADDGFSTEIWQDDCDSPGCVHADTSADDSSKLKGIHGTGISCEVLGSSEARNAEGVGVSKSIKDEISCSLPHTTPKAETLKSDGFPVAPAQDRNHYINQLDTISEEPRELHAEES